MRNKNSQPLTKTIISLTESLPYFRIESLKILDAKPNSLKIALFRLLEKKEIVRLKKGFYTSRKFIEKTKTKNNFSLFLEFLATKIYSPSYLSLDYVLYENNILTEIPKNFTLITKNKPTIFSNELGIFIYHKIKDELFLGFETKKIDDFLIQKASLAKALFDFLYSRKRIILNKKAAKELRLNLENFRGKKELKKYIDLDGSKKMREIYSYLFE